jgi:hypothetical protein
MGTASAQSCRTASIIEDSSGQLQRRPRAKHQGDELVVV